MRIKPASYGCWRFTALPCPAQVAPRSGFQPSWRAPLIAAVVVIALIISALLFVSLVSYKRQRLLLHETVVGGGGRWRAQEPR